MKLGQDEVRKGIEDYKDSQNAGILLFFEAVLVGIAAGLETETLWIGLAAPFVFMILLHIPYLQYFFIFTISLFWAFVSYSLVQGLGQYPEFIAYQGMPIVSSNPLPWLIGVVTFFASYGIHWNAVR